MRRSIVRGAAPCWYHCWCLHLSCVRFRVSRPCGGSCEGCSVSFGSGQGHWVRPGCLVGMGTSYHQLPGWCVLQQWLQAAAWLLWPHHCWRPAVGVAWGCFAFRVDVSWQDDVPVVEGCSVLASVPFFALSLCCRSPRPCHVPPVGLQDLHLSSLGGCQGALWGCLVARMCVAAMAGLVAGPPWVQHPAVSWGFGVCS